MKRSTRPRNRTPYVANAATLSNLDKGIPQLGGRYIGKLPVYADISPPGFPPALVKIKKGVPFVRNPSFLPPSC